MWVGMIPVPIIVLMLERLEVIRRKLINCVYKIVSKILLVGLRPIVDNLVSME